MRKALFVATVVVVASLILTSCATPATNYSLNIPVTKVEVTRYGFNSIPGEFRLEVEEGQEIEITFVYGDGNLAQNNPHTIASLEYGIDTGILDRNNPEATLRFTATKTGETVFECILPDCMDHHNLHGDAEEEHNEEDEPHEDEEPHD